MEDLNNKHLSTFYLGYQKNFKFVSVVQDLMKKKKIGYTDGGRGQKCVANLAIAMNLKAA